MITELQDHMPDPKDFDFSIFDDIFQQFPSYCDPAEEEFVARQEGLELLLDPKTVMAYLTWCLSKEEKFNTPLSDSTEIKKQVTPNFTNPNHIRFLKDAFIVGRIRLKGTLPLTEQEYPEAIKNLQGNPQLYRAVVTLRNFMRDYLTCVNERARESSLFDENSSEYTQNVFNNTITTLFNGISQGFLVEFAALTGLGVEGEQINFPAILHRVFAMPNAFKSVTNASNGIIEHKCPFADAASDILTRKFSEQADTEKENIPGGILVAILQKYDALEKPSNNKAKPLGHEPLV